MKNIIAILLFFGYTVASAQTAEEKGDTTRISMKKKIIEIIEDEQTGRSKVIITPIGGTKSDTIIAGEDEHEKEDEVKGFEMHAIALDAGISLFLHNGSLNYPVTYSGLDQRPMNSGNVTVHLLPMRIGMAKSHINLATAISLDHLQWAFAENTLLQPGIDTFSFFVDSTESYRKSKLNMTYLQVPLMLRFDTNPREDKKSFRLAIGGYYGILINSFTKIKTESGDKAMEKDDYNLNKMRYGVTGRIGFRNMEFYVNYNLSSLFRENRGPDVSPVSFGVGIGGAWR